MGAFGRIKNLSPILSFIPKFIVYPQIYPGIKKFILFKMGAFGGIKNLSPNLSFIP